MSRPAFLLAAGTNWLAFAATLAVGFFLMPFLADTLGPNRYGVWCVAEAVLAYFTLLDMGVAACLVRYVARHRATDAHDELNRLASSCLAVFVAAAGIALAVGAPALWAMAGRLEAKAGHPGDVLPFLLLMLATLAASLPLSVFPSVLDGLQRYTAKSAARLAFLAVRTALIVAVADRGLLAVGLATAAATAAEYLAFAVLVYRYLPGLRLRWRLIDRATLRQVRGYSTDAFLAMLAGRISLQTGAIVIGLLMPSAAAAGAFVTAARLVEYAKTLLRTVTTTLTPGVSALEARGDFDGIRRLFRTATRWLLYAVLPVNLGLWWFGEPFLLRWVPTLGADAAGPLAVLAGTLTLGVAQSVASRVLYGMGRLRLFARLALAEAAVNLLLTFLLIGPFGLEGVAAAVAGPNLLFCAWVIGYTLRVLGLSWGAYLRLWAKPLLAAAVPLGVWLAWGRVPPAWPAIVSAGATGMAAYGLVVAALELRALVPDRVRPARSWLRAGVS